MVMPTGLTLTVAHNRGQHCVMTTVVFVRMKRCRLLASGLAHLSSGAPTAWTMQNESTITINQSIQPTRKQRKANNERQTKNTVQSAQKRVSHFDTAKELMQQTLILEDSLLSLNIERSSLESELARMPCGTSGRTGAQRRRKVEVEQRLAQIAKDIGRVKRELKSIGAL